MRPSPFSVMPLLALLACPALAQAPSAPPLPGPDTAPVAQVTEDGRILLGEPAREVTPLELYRALGREDLLQQAEANRARRTELFLAAGAVAALSLGVGIALLATAPVMDGNSRCNQGDLAYYNDYCQPAHVLHTQAGTITLVAGLAGASLLAAFGLWIRPDVLTRQQLEELVDGAAPRPAVSGLRLVPWLLPQGGGLAAAGRF